MKYFFLSHFMENLRITKWNLVYIQIFRILFYSVKRLLNMVSLSFIKGICHALDSATA